MSWIDSPAGRVLPTTSQPFWIPPERQGPEWGLLNSVTRPQDIPSNMGPCYFQLSSLYSRPKHISVTSWEQWVDWVISPLEWNYRPPRSVHGTWSEPALNLTLTTILSQPSIGWWHFTVGGHSAFISFLLKSYPAFPVTTDGLQRSYLLTKVAFKFKIRSHNTFPLTFCTARSNFKPWYYCSGLTICNVIW